MLARDEKPQAVAQVGSPVAAAADSYLLGLSREDIILYVAAFVVCLIGAWGIWFSLDLAEAGLVLVSGIVIGFAVSIWARKTKEPLLYSMIFLGAALAIMLLMRLTGVEQTPWAQTYVSLFSDPTQTAVASMSLVLISSAFVLISRSSLTFVIVPVLSLFGLLGALLEAKIVAGFLVFLFIGVFLLGFEHAIGLRENLGIKLSRRSVDWLPREQLLVSAGFSVLVLLLALGMATLLMLIFSQYSAAGVLNIFSDNDLVKKMSETTLPQNSSSFNTTSNDYQVGRGPISLSDTPIMYVKADSPELWRQRAYDIYTGSGWKASGGEAAVTVNKLQDGKLSLAQFAPRTPNTRTIRQTYRLAKAFQSGIPAAAQPVAVNFNTDTALPASTVSVDRFGCLVRTDSILPPGYQYQIISYMPSMTGPPGDAWLDAVDRDRYLQVPWKAMKVADLVKQITRTGSTPREQMATVSDLLAYLQSDKFRYSLQAAAVPSDEDAASYFLFKSQEGYCDLFATAFAVMCRTADIPSRFVIGYGEGEPDPQTGEYVVKQADGHAWVEVFIAGYGWLTFDPTPAGAAAEALKQARAGPSWWARLMRHSRGKVIFAVLCSVVALSLAKSYWFNPWWRRKRWERQMYATMRGRLILFYDRMCRRLAKRGLIRHPWLTPLEYLHLLDKYSTKVGAAHQPAKELTRLFIASRYGPGEVSEETVAAARAALQRFERSLGRRR